MPSLGSQSVVVTTTLCVGLFVLSQHFCALRVFVGRSGRCGSTFYATSARDLALFRSLLRGQPMHVFVCLFAVNVMVRVDTSLDASFSYFSKAVVRKNT